MKRLVAGMLLMSFLVLIWAQNAVINTTEPSETPKDTTHALAVNNDNNEDEPEEESFEKGYDSGMLQGRMRGSQQSQTGWMAAGCGGGYLLGCIGAGGVWLLANSSGEFPTYVPKGNSEFRAGYTDGYIQATKSKKASSAMIGGFAGIAALVVTILLVYPSVE